MLFVRQGTLLAQAFDAKTLTLSGEPFPVAQRVQMGTPAGHIAFSVSDTGVLTYGVGGDAGAVTSQLTWINRQGTVVGTVGTPEDIRGLDLSPDGTRVAAHRHLAGQGGDVWITDLSRGTTSRFTFDATQHNASPIWSRDGATPRSARCAEARMASIGRRRTESGNDEMPIEQLAEIAPMDFSPDGRSLVYQVTVSGTGPDLFILPLTGERDARKPVPLSATRFAEHHGQVSPDGRWLAYVSTESGNNEVYVRPFPTGGGKWQVSSRGAYPRWRRDGRELFYLNYINPLEGAKVVAVDVRTSGSAFEAGLPKPLFDSGCINLVHPSPYHAYAVTLDGQRFLIPRPIANTTDNMTSQPVIVVMNWPQEVRGQGAGR